MPAAPLRPSVYDALLRAYRKAPGDHAKAAKAAKVVWRTARKAWDDGWPKLGWAPAIKTVLAENELANAAPAIQEEAEGVEVEQAPAVVLPPKAERPQRPPRPPKPPRAPAAPRPPKPAKPPKEPRPVPPGPDPVPEPPPAKASLTAAATAKSQLSQLAQATRAAAIANIGIVLAELQAIGPTRDSLNRIVSRGLVGRIQDDLRALEQNPVIAVEWDRDGKPTKTRRYLPHELIGLHEKLVVITERTTRAAVLSMAMERTFIGTMIPLLDAQGVASEMSLEEALAEALRVDAQFRATFEQARGVGIIPARVVEEGSG